MKNKFAHFLSNAFSPFVLAPMLIMLLSEGNMRIGIITIGLLILPLSLYIYIQVKRGLITNFHVREREQRPPLYKIGFVSVILTLLFLHFSNAPKFLMVSILSVLFLSTVGFFVNKKIKISVHAGTLACITVLLTYLYGYYVGLLMLLLTLAVMWSRVVINAHTKKEVTLGFINGSLITLLTLMLFL